MSRHPQKTTVAAKFVYAKKANIGSLRAKSLTVADPLSKLNAKSIVSSGNTQTQTIAIGDKKGNGALTAQSKPDNDKEIVILGEWHDALGAVNAVSSSDVKYAADNQVQLTLFRKGRKNNKGPPSANFHFEFSKGALIQGDLILGTPSSGPLNFLHANGISLYNYNGATQHRRTLFCGTDGRLYISPDGNSTDTGEPIEVTSGTSPDTQFSDDRLKHNETEIKNATATLAKLKPYVYDMTQTFLPADYKGPLDEKKTPYRKESGFIAQEIQQIPELEHLVVPGDETTPFKLNYNGFLAFLVEGFQEMSAEIKALKAKVQSLEAASASS